jgi:hypothetical protein
MNRTTVSAQKRFFYGTKIDFKGVNQYYNLLHIIDLQ